MYLAFLRCTLPLDVLYLLRIRTPGRSELRESTRFTYNLPCASYRRRIFCPLREEISHVINPTATQ